jgi:Ca2+-binding RTX toxin-like protein
MAGPATSSQGGDGDDSLTGTSGFATMDGGSGQDLLVVARSTSAALRFDFAGAERSRRCWGMG